MLRESDKPAGNGRALAQPPRSTPSVSEPAPDYVSGKIQEQYVRCGKSNCHCTQGELHGPYYYRIWRDGMRTRKVYVKPDEVDSVRAVCEENSDRMAQLRQMRQQRRLANDQLRSIWRTTQALFRAK